MSNYHVEPIDQPQALTKEAIKSLRKQQVQGISRRQLMRAAIGTGIGLWLLEVTAGTIGFIWPNLKGGFGAPIAIGDLDTVKLQNSSLPIEEGFPAYYSEARAFVILFDPGQQRFLPARTRRAMVQGSTSAPSTSAARTSAASRTRASRTSGSSARATARATTGSGSRPTAPRTALRRAGWTASRSPSTAPAC